MGGGDDDFALAGGEQVVAKFESTPAGAVVMLDGKLVCQTTPCSKAVAAGRHQVAMQKERYEQAGETTVLGKGSKVALTLAPVFGWLTVQTVPEGLPVHINGEDAGRAPILDREVDPAGYEVVVVDPCYVREGERVAVKKGEKRAVKIAPKARMGAVQVSAEDAQGNALEAVVSVDATPVGNAPGTFKVPICVAEIVVRTADGLEWKGPLELREKETKEVRAVLSQPAPEIIAHVPPPEPPPPPEMMGHDRWQAGEFVLRAGAGGHLGVLGVGLEFRPVRHIGFAVGTGTYLATGGISIILMLVDSWDGQPPLTMYLDAHVALSRPGLLGESLAEGYGVGATLGIEIRPTSFLSIKLGAGGAWTNANERAPYEGPLPLGAVFDASLGVVL